MEYLTLSTRNITQSPFHLGSKNAQAFLKDPNTFLKPTKKIQQFLEPLFK